ncbi:Re/Si-specific NAD(P)(+) transhydrogenase subunit alpha [Beggiatoa leptomitoformis]|uniref:proton-translocating NAD(P)(+) transhydrogenase n=1 Tax=Beggiatoa leptomitoformis TaxID=288004 RepID=A0A2N9YE37_9GAMM|nr:Re/Si-specific NAD(P)(+) transhydrogenase subunit alpha [Beggiatoa leptomitoformis]ALG68965.1 Re/Si-specific NAD(P)(+) transhydrogenase subunit alpha [Beggiatoa leptomitoformis]AUI68645.1 Re/Si-specific NAD(P)(+) transhydrogenase subunit alpha [Beggiatoa leptomitoformis]
MPINVAVPTELAPEERRVALVPDVAGRLIKLGATVLIEKEMGQRAYFADAAYKDVQIVDTAIQLYAQADVVLKVSPPTEAEIEQMKAGTIVIGFMSPHRYPERVTKMRDKQITSLAMELVPRISRAQSMDALSSQAAVAGYKAVLQAADLSNVFFPMLTTAAGTIRPAKVLVIGAGVAGLQAIATARRLGAIVEGYDVRSATKEQVQSLGAKFVDTGLKAEGTGGYARELTTEEKQQQQDVLAKHIAAANVVITTAAIPGRPSPKIITTAMVEGMAAGAVVVDLAAEGGGNCELCQPGKTIVHNGVTIHAPLNVPSQMPTHASEMYAKNLFNLLSLFVKNGQLEINWQDEVIAGCTLTHAGEIKHAPTRALVEGVKS